MLRNPIPAALLGIACLGVAPQAQAHEPGDWLFRFGATLVAPDSDNHAVVSVEDGTSASINIAYVLRPNWVIDLLAAYPFEHDIDLVGGPKVASTEHLPPTLSLQYHFAPDAKWQPYIGLGLNYTTFFSEKTSGPLAGSDLKLDDSWGLASQVGVDIRLDGKWFLNADVRYIDIDTDASLDGADLGTVAIDPWTYGLHAGFRF